MSERDQVCDDDQIVRIWLDDVRPAPEGWRHVKDPRDCITMLASLDRNPSVIVSLDHDLGEAFEEMGLTGYTVAKWIEERAYTDREYAIPTIMCHSDNPPGRQAIMMTIGSIERLKKQRGIDFIRELGFLDK